MAVATAKRSRAQLLGESPNTGTLPDSVTLDDLAILLGVVPRAVTEMARQNHVIRIGHGEYDLRKSVLAYCNHLRGRASSATLTAERIRQTKEQADLLAFKNAKSKAELLDASEVERAWAGILRDLRAALLAVPSRVGSRVPALTPHDIGEIAREIKDALSELAGEKDHAGN